MNMIMVKLVNGQICIGSHDELEKCIVAPAEVMGVPTQSGYNFGIVPMGYPFEQEINREAKIPMDKVIYQYKEVPKGLADQYTEKLTGIKLASPNQILNLVKK